DADAHVTQPASAALPAAVEATRAAPNAAPSPSPAPSEPEPAPVLAKPAQGQSAPTASANKPALHVRSHTVKIAASSSAVVPQPSVAPSTAPKPNLAQAWDSASFGPRR